MNRIMRIKTVMFLKTGNRNLGLQTQADIDIGPILDILDSVREMNEEVYAQVN